MRRLSCGRIVSWGRSTTPCRGALHGLTLEKQIDPRNPYVAMEAILPFRDVESQLGHHILAEYDALSAASRGGGLPGPAPHDGGTDRVGPKMDRKAADEKARQLAKADPSFVHLKAWEWAARIPCAVGLVPKLAFWRQVMVQSGRARQRTKNGKPRRTTYVEGMFGAGEPNEILNRLIEEEESTARNAVERCTMSPEAKAETIEKLSAVN